MGSERDERTPAEAEIHAALADDDLERAARRILEAYGAELFAFSRTLLSGVDEAEEAFQTFCEQMWKSLPTFRGDSSARTWAYAITRRVAWKIRNSPHRPARRNVPLSASPEVAAIADRVRTETAGYLRTEVKDRVTRLRERLEPEERELFVLRLNRKMSWTEIVDVVEGGAAERSPAERSKRAAALRKRFQRAKDRLRRLVEADSVLSPPAEQ